ncbi:unnamed protein product [Rhizophagus irregularis]|nr:unnamed protein product [Rhizophagus irregularis]
MTLSRNLLDFSNNVNRRHYRRNANRRNQRRIQRQRPRIITRMYGRRAVINNTDILRLIAQLPLQTTNDPFANQLFNGSPF